MIYYLDRCAYINAQSLNDADAVTTMRSLAHLLQTSVLIISTSEDDRLRISDDVSDEWLLWSMKSVEHMIWLLAFYECLRLRYNYFKSTDIQRPWTNVIREYLHCYPRLNPPKHWVDPQNLAQERAYYEKHRVNRDKYKQVPVPYWAVQPVHRSKATLAPPPVKAWSELDDFFEPPPVIA